LRTTEGGEAALVVNVHSFIAILTVQSSLTNKKNRAAQRDFVSIQIDVEFEVDSVGGFIVNFHHGGQIWALAAAVIPTQAPIGILVGDRVVAAVKFSKIMAVETFEGS
jgi:hypothetical protein